MKKISEDYKKRLKSQIATLLIEFSDKSRNFGGLIKEVHKNMINTIEDFENEEALKDSIKKEIKNDFVENDEINITGNNGTINYASGNSRITSKQTIYREENNTSNNNEHYESNKYNKYNK